MRVHRLGFVSIAMTLEQQRADFASRKFLALPISGTIAWLAVAACGVVFSGNEFALALSLFIATGSIFYLALIVERFTGEDILGRRREKNEFDKFFFLAAVQALAVYAIAIPFFLIERSSLPLSVGILTGLMWVQFSGFTSHWIGYAHAASRTLVVLLLWYSFPDSRYIAVPLGVVAIYLMTIVLLINRTGPQVPVSNADEHGH